MELGALCGMSETEFWNCTPRYMSAKVRALESSQRLSWEQSRYIAFHAIKVADHKNRIKGPKDLGSFPWETDNVVFPEITKEDQDNWSDGADEFLKQVNPEAYAAYMAGKKTQND